MTLTHAKKSTVIGRAVGGMEAASELADTWLYNSPASFFFCAAFCLRFCSIIAERS